MPSKLRVLLRPETPARLLAAGMLLWASVPLVVSADGAPEKPTPADPKPGQPKPGQPSPEEPQPSCRLITEEAPRGGRVEVEAARVGRTPLLLIGGRVTRILLRKQDLISAQIPRDSDGGMVTVKVDGRQVPCGTLTIIGKN